MSIYKPCPSCGEDAAEKVYFTWWGGLVGPAILTHVRCRHCGTTYNGKSGKSNTNLIIIYYCVIFALVFGFCFLAMCLGILGGNAGNH